MRRLTLLLTITATLAIPSVAEAFPCYKNGKWTPPQTCAFINMNEYVTGAYFRPTMQAFWVKPTSVGRFHSRWMAYVATGGPSGGLLVRRRVTVSASRCRGTYVMFDHRKQQWSSAC